ncbi:hypothetical protein ACFV16_39860 [Streptomyces massasporeus]
MKDTHDQHLLEADSYLYAEVGEDTEEAFSLSSSACICFCTTPGGC